MRREYEDDPWNVPVPIKASRFVPLKAAHRRFNLETDLARLHAFAYAPRAVAARELLFCDLQTNADANVRARLGSGRAGCYDGKYLKGTGRTLATGNWNRSNDSYHNSGHLNPSGAIREYLATAYLRAKGYAHTINGCEGLLLRPLDRRLGDVVRTLGPARAAVAPRIDHRFQAITIKDAGFARASNFIWLLNHASPRPEFFADFFSRLQRRLSPPGGPLLADNECTPGKLVDTFTGAIDRALEHFAGFFRAGIYWGSFHNNFTLDGRFLDLEVPIILGAPFFGVTRSRPLDGARATVGQLGVLVGTEVVLFATQMRLIVQLLIDRLRFITRHLFVGKGAVRDFIGELSSQMERRLVRRHRLFSNRDLAVWLEALLHSTFELTPPQKKETRRLLDAIVRSWFGSTSAARRTVALEPAPLAPADPEPGYRVHLYRAALFPAAEVSAEAELVNDLLRRLDALDDLDALLAGVAEAEAAIRAGVSSARTDRAAPAPRRRPPAADSRRGSERG